MTKQELQNQIQNFLNKNNIMTLATNSKDIWVSIVFYGIDSELKLYIVTDQDTKHGKHIEENNKIAFSVFDSHQNISNDKIGIQAQGSCTKVTNPIEFVKGIGIWHKFNKEAAKILSIDVIKNAGGYKLYKIEPTTIKFYNEELFSENDFEVWTQDN